MEDIEVLESLIKKGFYPDNLYEMSSFCKKLVESKNNYSLVFYVFKTIFLSLANDWEGEPVEVEESNSYNKLIPLFQN